MTRIQRMTPDSAKAILDRIKGCVANISIKSLDGLSPSEAETLEELLAYSEQANSHIVEGIAPKLVRLQLPSENFGAKNQSDWEGLQLAKKLTHI